MLHIFVAFCLYLETLLRMLSIGVRLNYEHFLVSSRPTFLHSNLSVFFRSASMPGNWNPGPWTSDQCEDHQSRSSGGKYRAQYLSLKACPARRGPHYCHCTDQHSTPPSAPRPQLLRPQQRQLKRDLCGESLVYVQQHLALQHQTLGHLHAVCTHLGTATSRPGHQSPRTLQQRETHPDNHAHLIHLISSGSWQIYTATPRLKRSLLSRSEHFSRRGFPAGQETASVFWASRTGVHQRFHHGSQPLLRQFYQRSAEVAVDAGRAVYGGLQPGSPRICWPHRRSNVRGTTITNTAALWYQERAKVETMFLNYRSGGFVK